MKKTLFIIGLLIGSYSCYSQTFLPPRSSATTTVQDSRLRSLLTFYYPHTHGLTLNGGLDTLGAVVYEDSSGHVWYRDTVMSGGHRWRMMLSFGDAVSGVSSFNTRTGVVTLQSSDVISALNYTPVNPNGTTSQYIAGDGSKVTFPSIPAQINITDAGLFTHSGTYPNYIFTGVTPTQQQVFTQGSTLNQNNFWITGANVLGITGTAAFGLPTGSTSQRPSSPGTGYFRYNTDSAATETYNGSQWVKTGTGTGGGGGLTAGGGLSPLFTNGVSGSTLTFTAVNAAANTAFGNFTGSSAAGAFGKIPLAAMATGTVNSLIGYSGSGNPSVISIGTGLSLSSGILTATGSSLLTANGGGDTLNGSNIELGGTLTKSPITKYNGFVPMISVPSPGTGDNANQVWRVRSPSQGTKTSDFIFLVESIHGGQADTSHNEIMKWGWNINKIINPHLAEEHYAMEYHYNPFNNSRYMENHLELGTLNGNQTRLFSSTTIVSPDDSSIVSSQWDFRQSKFNFMDLQSRQCIQIDANSGGSDMIFYKNQTVDATSTTFGWEKTPGDTTQFDISGPGGSPYGLTIAGWGAVNVGGRLNVAGQTFLVFGGRSIADLGDIDPVGNVDDFYNIGASARRFRSAYIDSGYVTRLKIGLDLSVPVDPSAALDINVTNSGFLPPRLNTTQQNAIPSPANGLFIYNTDSLKYRFYNGSAWVSFGAGGGSGSQTLTYAQNALNNTLAISGGNSQTFLTGTSSLAGLLDTARAKLIDSIKNRTFTGLGISTLDQVTTAGNTTANSISIGALTSSADASIHGVTIGLGGGAQATNMAGGTDALVANTSGSVNAAFGYKSQETMATGFGNTSVGAQALDVNSAGNENTAVGWQAGATSTGSANVFLGSQAGADQTTGSNKLWIANSATANLVYGDFSTGQLMINAQVTPTFLSSDNFQVNGSSYLSDSVILRNVRTGTSSDSVAVLHQLSSGKFVIHKVAQSGFGGAVLSVSNVDGTLTISPTTGAVVASLALGHANTWTGKQTQPAPIFTGMTSAGANDSVATIDPATGQMHWRTGTTPFYFANGLTASTVIPDSAYLGGPLNQATTITTNGFALSFVGLPNKASPISTDSILFQDIAGKLWKTSFSVVGSGPWVRSVNQINTTAPTTDTVNIPGRLTIAGTTSEDYTNTVAGAVNQSVFNLTVRQGANGSTTANLTGIRIAPFVPTSGSNTAGIVNGVLVDMSTAPSATVTSAYAFNVLLGTSTNYGSQTGFQVAGANVANRVAFATNQPNCSGCAAFSSSSDAPILINGAIGINQVSPAVSSLIDIVSTNKGILLPRMTTTNIAAISSPATFLLVVNTDSASTNHPFAYFDGTAWRYIGINSGGGGGAVSAVSNSDGTLTISPTTGAVIASLNLGHANTFTAAQTVNAAFVTNSTVNLTGLAYSAGGSTFDVITQDTTTGKIWRQPYFSVDTTGFSGGNGMLDFNGSKFKLTKVANGLTFVSDSLKLGGTLNQNTTIGGTPTGFNVTFGYPDSLGAFTINAKSGIILRGAVLESRNTIGDADQALPSNYNIFQAGSPALTANRTITLPSASSNDGRKITICNLNTNGFHYLIASNLVNPNSVAVTQLDNGATYVIESHGGSNWFVTSVYSSNALKYSHTIFTPTTGGTVSLVNGQYNIINPAGSLLALTVNLPSSPANNDVVYIKFTQTISTVTYANGTVVDGITAPTAGGLTVLTYDAGTTSWY